MSRHRFRSQPSLQRSGGRAPSGLLGVGLLAVLGVGAGAFLGNLIRTAEPPAAPQRTYAAMPLDQPAVAAAPPAALPAAVAQPLQVRAAAPVVSLKAHASRAPRAAKPLHTAVLKPIAPQLEWEQQRRDYEQARAAYDAGERRAGFRWAQQNNIRVERYCRVAAQRTSAFMEGCVNYLRTGRAPAPGEAGAPRVPEQG